MGNDVTGKTVVVGIALIFVFGAFIPAVGSQSKSVYDVGSSEMIKIGVEESIDSQAVSGYTESWDIGNTVLSMCTQTIIGLVNIVANNPIINGISDMITGDETSNDDNVSIGASCSEIVTAGALIQLSKGLREIRWYRSCRYWVPLDVATL